MNYDPDKGPLFVGLSVETRGGHRQRAHRSERGQVSSGLPIERTHRNTVNASSRVINPWIVAVAVIVPTFMEVLDTTVANVALRYIAGGLSAAEIRQRVGDHHLSRRQCHRSADHRLAGLPFRTTALFSLFHRSFYGVVSALRTGYQPRRTDFFSCLARAGRRRPPAMQSGNLARYFSAGKARLSPNGIRARRAARTGRRANARRLPHRPIFLAMDFLYQRARRHCRVLLLRGGRP